MDNQPTFSSTPTAVIDLMTALRDPSRNLESAVTALPAQDIPIAVAEIDSLLNSNPIQNVRRRAFHALSLLKHPDTIAVLGNILVEDQNERHKRIALGALQQHDISAATPYLIRAHERTQDDLRASVTYALGSAVEILVKRHEVVIDTQRRNEIIAHVNLIGLNHLNALLTESDVVSVQQAAATALGLTADPAAAPLLCSFLETDRRRQQLDQLDDANQLDQLARDQGRVTVLFSIIDALRQLGDARGIDCLNDLLTHDRNFRVRRLAAATLGSLTHSAALPALVRAFLTDNVVDVRRVAGEALSNFTDWRRKTIEIIHDIKTNGLEQSQLDVNAIITTIRPPAAELTSDNRFSLTDFLIETSLEYRDDPRITALFSTLIVASANSSKNLAAERLDAYQQAQGLSDETLQNLRVEIGGAKVLTPILDKLEKNLEENFQKPIKLLNDQTQVMWQDTIRRAYFGFAMRVGMSIAAFLIGAILVLLSFSRFLSGQVTLTELFGPGVFLISGIGLMVSMVFSGPLSEIRQSVNDVAIANAAFIGYIHRVLEISHTFSYYYLQNRISFEELSKSSDLIEDAMGDTIRLLQESMPPKRSFSIPGVSDQASPPPAPRG